MRGVESDQIGFGAGPLKPSLEGCIYYITFVDCTERKHLPRVVGYGTLPEEECSGAVQCNEGEWAALALAPIFPASGCGVGGVYKPKDTHAWEMFGMSKALTSVNHQELEVTVSELGECTDLCGEGLRAAGNLMSTAMTGSQEIWLIIHPMIPCPL